MCLMKWMRMTERQTTNANSAAQGGFLSSSNNYMFVYVLQSAENLQG